MAEASFQTLIVVILDQSGSMHSQKGDIIGGYNSFVTTQRTVTADKVTNLRFLLICKGY